MSNLLQKLIFNTIRPHLFSFTRFLAGISVLYPAAVTLKSRGEMESIRQTFLPSRPMETDGLLQNRSFCIGFHLDWCPSSVSESRNHSSRNPRRLPLHSAFSHALGFSRATLYSPCGTFTFSQHSLGYTMMLVSS